MNKQDCKVGDTVLVIGSRFAIANALVGKTGTIVKMYNKNASVDFNGRTVPQRYEDLSLVEHKPEEQPVTLFPLNDYDEEPDYGYSGDR